MPINLKPLIDKIMDDPDIIPEEGVDKKALALDIATQRAKQTVNNNLALNLAKTMSAVDLLSEYTGIMKAPNKKKDPSGAMKKNIGKWLEENKVKGDPESWDDLKDLYMSALINHAIKSGIWTHAIDEDGQPSYDMGKPIFSEKLNEEGTEVRNLDPTNIWDAIINVGK